MKARIEFSWTVGQLAISCEHGNEPSDTKNERYSLNSLRTISFLRKTLLHGVIYLIKTNGCNNF